MSNIETDKLKLTEIKAPDLTSSDYGGEIKQQFENIDSNFRKLANYDFVKGERGADLEIESLKIFNDENAAVSKTTLTAFGATVINVILNRDDIVAGTDIKDIKLKDEDESVLTYNWYDYLVDGDKGDESTSQIKVFYRNVNQLLKNSIKEYIGAPLPFIFIDSRFSSQCIQDVDKQESSYDLFMNISDKSCALYVKYENGWKVERISQFPTLYYDENMFKWKLSDRESGIIAQGVRGLSGRDGHVWIAKVKVDKDFDFSTVTNTYFSIYEVMKYHNLSTQDEMWLKPEDAAEEKNGGLREGDTVIVIPVTDIGSTDKAEERRRIWFTVVKKLQNSEGEKYTVYYDKDCELTVNIGNTWMFETMKAAGANDSLVKGLFLRVFPDSIVGEDPSSTAAHMLYTQSSEEDDPEKNVVVFSPVKSFENPTNGKYHSGKGTHLIVKDYDKFTLDVTTEIPYDPTTFTGHYLTANGFSTSDIYPANGKFIRVNDNNDPTTGDDKDYLEVGYNSLQTGTYDSTGDGHNYGNKPLYINPKGGNVVIGRKTDSTSSIPRGVSVLDKFTVAEDARFNKDVNVDGYTTLNDTTIKPTGGAPVYFDQNGSGPIFDVIKNNWTGIHSNSTTGIELPVVVVDKEETPETPASVVTSIGSKIRTSNSTKATILSEPFGVSCIGILRYFSPMTTFNLDYIYGLYLVGNRSGEHLLDSDQGLIRYLYPTSVVESVTFSFNFSLFKNKKYEVEGIVNGEDLHIELRVEIPDHSTAFNPVTYDRLEMTPRTKGQGISIVQPTSQSDDDYQDNKSFVHGNLTILGVNRHRTIGLYVDGRSDAAYKEELKKSELDVIDRNVLSGLVISFMNKDNKEGLILIPVRELFRGIYGYDLEDCGTASQPAGTAPSFFEFKE